MQARQPQRDINREITVVIPTLNEAQAIGAVIDELKSLGYTNILVVDGHSTDGTPEIAREKGAKVVTQRGTGKADAIKTALKHVQTEYMLVMDGDYTYPAKHIHQLYRKAVEEDLDHVIGARLSGRENIPLLNRLGNWVLTKTFNLLFGTSLKDLCSGMYLIRTSTARDAALDTAGFSIEAELAAHTAATTRRIGETPIEYRPRIGKPKLHKRHGIQILKDIILLAWRYHPAFFIFATASLALIPAAIILTWVALEYIIKGTKHFVWAIIGVTMASTGTQALLMAIMALYIKRIEYRIYEKARHLYTNTQTHPQTHNTPKQ